MSTASSSIGPAIIVTILGGIAIGAVVVGILGLTHTVSLTVVGGVTVATAFVNPFFFYFPLIFGSLGIAQVVPMSVVSSVVIATQGLVVLACALGVIGLIRRSKERANLAADIEKKWIFDSTIFS